MYILDIKWLDEDNKEAIVTVGDSEYRITCFADNLKYNVGEDVPCHLNALELKDIMLEETDVPDRITMDNLSCKIIGVLDDKKSVIRAGSIIISLDNAAIPKDIKDGEKISAEISRVDLW